MEKHHDLVHGKYVGLPSEFEIKALRTTLQVGMDLSNAQKHHLKNINDLDEIHQAILYETSIVPQQTAKWHDKFIEAKKSQIRDWTLLFDSRFMNFKGNICTTWLVP